jgi:hypothetical protein
MLAGSNYSCKLRRIDILILAGVCDSEPSNSLSDCVLFAE